MESAGGAMTSGEVAQELINNSRRMGLTGETGKSKPAVSRLKQWENSTPPFLTPSPPP